MAHEKADDMRIARFDRSGREEERLEEGFEEEGRGETGQTTGPVAAVGERTVGVGAPWGAGGTHSQPTLSRPAELVVACAVALCVTVAVVHVLMAFLYVAPANTISTQYSQQINAWVDPYFDQNWRLFAPDPQSAEQQISARTAKAGPHGGLQVGGWVDLSAVDEAAVRHDPFPSHTAQNMLRRAWAAYLDSHGNNDQSASPQAQMFQEYLLNIAAQRVAAHGQRGFDLVQLRVVTTPIAPASSRATGSAAPASASSVRYLPWWKVQSHDH